MGEGGRSRKKLGKNKAGFNQREHLRQSILQSSAFSLGFYPKGTGMQRGVVKVSDNSPQKVHEGLDLDDTSGQLGSSQSASCTKT